MSRETDILKGMAGILEHKKNAYSPPKNLKAWRKVGMFDLNEEESEDEWEPAIDNVETIESVEKEKELKLHDE